MIDEVSEILRAAAAEAILPRYKALSDRDVEEKSAGEIVTVADRDAEEIITRRLLDFLPGSRVVGEEACAADSSIMDNLSDGAVWLVDPLDGTSNFAAGRPPFAVMAALLKKGHVVAAWMLDPLADQLFVGEHRSGAFLDGNRITTTQTSPGIQGLRGVVATRFMPQDMRSAMTVRAQALAETKPLMLCTGAEYPDVATGARHFALYWRVLPWDHAPGALFLTEAGGHVARPGGAAYLAGDQLPGLLVARNFDVWRDAHAALYHQTT